MKKTIQKTALLVDKTATISTSKVTHTHARLAGGVRKQPA